MLADCRRLAPHSFESRRKHERVHRQNPHAPAGTQHFQAAQHETGVQIAPSRGITRLEPADDGGIQISRTEIRRIGHDHVKRIADAVVKQRVPRKQLVRANRFCDLDLQTSPGQIKRHGIDVKADQIVLNDGGLDFIGTAARWDIGPACLAGKGHLFQVHLSEHVQRDQTEIHGAAGGIANAKIDRPCRASRAPRKNLPAISNSRAGGYRDAFRARCGPVCFAEGIRRSISA